MTEYSLAQKAFHDNRERLKAERLAREALVTSGKAINQGPGEEAEKNNRFFASGTLGFRTQPLMETRPGATHESFSCTSGAPLASDLLAMPLTHDPRPMRGCADRGYCEAGRPSHGWQTPSSSRQACRARQLLWSLSWARAKFKLRLSPRARSPSLATTMRPKMVVSCF
jgi:hypothetical protein